MRFSKRLDMTYEHTTANNALQLTASKTRVWPFVLAAVLFRLTRDIFPAGN
jgi:hypothetical protein